MANNLILALGDLHAPYHERRVVKAFIREVACLKPTTVVQVGDATDQFGFSRFAKQLKITPEQEMRDALKFYHGFWDDVRAASPAARCIQLLGNHDMRMGMRVVEKLPEIAPFVAKVQDLYKHDGVEVQQDYRTPVRIVGPDGVPILLMHGYLKSLGDHMNKFGARVICGHSHRPGVVFSKSGGPGSVLWELNCGFAADRKAPVFKYGETSEHGWTTGYALVDSLGPRFVPVSR